MVIGVVAMQGWVALHICIYAINDARNTFVDKMPYDVKFGTHFKVLKIPIGTLVRFLPTNPQVEKEPNAVRAKYSHWDLQWLQIA